MVLTSLLLHNYFINRTCLQFYIPWENWELPKNTSIEGRPQLKYYVLFVNFKIKIALQKIRFTINLKLYQANFFVFIQFHSDACADCDKTVHINFKFEMVSKTIFIYISFILCFVSSVKYRNLGRKKFDFCINISILLFPSLFPFFLLSAN